MLTDAQGIPLAATVTAANVNEVTQVFDVLTNMPPVVVASPPPRRKPERLQGDTGYDSEPVRQLLRWLGITPIMGERRLNMAWGYTAAAGTDAQGGLVGYAAIGPRDGTPRLLQLPVAALSDTVVDT